MSTGIPSLLIVLSWISDNARFDELERRFAGSIDGPETERDGRIGGLERRVDGIDARLDRHDRRFDELLAAGHQDCIEILRSVNRLQERLAVVEAKQG